MGYYRAGFTQIVGVDTKPQPRYPFEFVQADALDFPLDGFTHYHASPPCQAYSRSKNNGCHKNAPKLISQVRDRLEATGLPYVIENVEGAPLEDIPLFGVNTILICGAYFGLGVSGFDLNRHRLFESNIMLVEPPCVHRRGQTIGVYGNGTNAWHWKKFGRCVTTNEARSAMGIDWMARKELTQAIPPAYTEFLGRQLIVVLTETSSFASASSGRERCQ